MTSVAQQRISRQYGLPFRGCVTSIDRLEVPVDALGPDSHDLLIEPNPVPEFTKVKRRHGAAGVGSATGILEVPSTAATMKSLRLFDMPTDSSSDGFSVLAEIWADESNRYGQVYIRDAVDHVEGAESTGGFHYYNGAQMDIISPPIPYDGNGATGYTRYATTDLRLRTVAGSRNSVGIKNREYFGGFLSAATNTNRGYNTAIGSGTNKLIRFPTGLIMPLRAATRVDGDYPAIGAQGQWQWGDQYYEAWGFEFEDGSRSLPTIPRSPQGGGATLPTGLALITVGKAADAGAVTPNNNYLYVPDRNIRIGPPGTRKRLKYRTNKITKLLASTGSVPDLTTLALAAIIEDNTTTSYNDPKGNDINLAVDTIMRTDQIWQPRSRYEWAFDQRKACAYVRPGPYAIIVGPTGDVADGDVNYSAENGWPTAVTWLVQLQQATTGVLTLRLRRVASFGGAPVNNSLVLTGLALQDVVDWICATTHLSASAEWRAQLVPGAGLYVAATNLAPTQVNLNNCSNGLHSATLTVPSTADLAEGMWINDPGWTLGTYIKTKVNATTLTMSAISVAGSGAPHAMEFNVQTADDNWFTDATAHSQFGNMVTIGNSCPVILAFKQAYLDQFPTDKRDWMITAGGPADRPYGANIYHSSPGCRRTVESDAGIFMGGAPLKRGCILFCSNWIGYCVNTSQSASGADADYRTIWLDKGHGCKSPYSIVFGNGWAGCWRDDGFWITDGESSRVISGDHLRILASGVYKGEFAYEAGLCNAAAAADTNDFYMHAHYRDGILWLSYRVSAGVFATACYDASISVEKTGVAQMLQPGTFGPSGTPILGQPFGWSPRCSYSWRSRSAGCGGAIGSVRKSDGVHLYQCDDKNDKANGGLTQEFETTGAYTDGADSVAWDLYLAADRAGGLNKSCVGGPSVFVFKNTVSSGGSQVTGAVYRDQARAASSAFTLPLTPGTDVNTRKVVNLPLATRSPSELLEIKLSGGATAAEQIFELSGVELPIDVLDLVT